MTWEERLNDTCVDTFTQITETKDGVFLKRSNNTYWLINSCEVLNATHCTQAAHVGSWKK